MIFDETFQPASLPLVFGKNGEVLNATRKPDNEMGSLMPEESNYSNSMGKSRKIDKPDYLVEHFDLKQDLGKLKREKLLNFEDEKTHHEYVDPFLNSTLAYRSRSISKSQWQLELANQMGFLPYAQKSGGPIPDNGMHFEDDEPQEPVLSTQMRKLRFWEMIYSTNWETLPNIEILLKWVKTQNCKSFAIDLKILLS